MRVHFTTRAWTEFIDWASPRARRADASVTATIIGLIEMIRRTPFTGLGKPGLVRGRLGGAWSRRITSEHRLVCRVEGRAGEDQRVELVSCRQHC